MSNITIYGEKDLSTFVAHIPEHEQMLTTIRESLPEVHRASSLFFKTQSQFMDNMLTVSHFTPLRNIQQCLAEMNQRREAIKHNHLKMCRNKIEIEKKKEQLENSTDKFEKQLLELDIMELSDGIETTKAYLSGAIRILANYTEQVNNIKKAHGITEFTEADFEKEEEDYHIAKAFTQALTAARARGGLIDEGNHIYLNQIGINGATAQLYMNQLFVEENKLITGGKEPGFELEREFITAMITKFRQNAQKLAEVKGMKRTTDTALLSLGDTTLLKQQISSAGDDVNNRYGKMMKNLANK